MSVVRRNAFSNFVGSAWVAVLSLAFIPLYIHFMGIEAYGLVGFFTTLQIVFSIMDMGLTATISRELARLSALDNKAKEMRETVRTLEVVYWLLALLVGVVLSVGAHWIAESWVNSKALPVEAIAQSVLLMGLIIALRMPYGFYSGALVGLQKQGLLNVIKVTVETLKHGGAVAVLWLISSDVTTFFFWQGLVSGLAAVFMFFTVWRLLPAAALRPTFKPAIFRRLGRFIAGMSGISVLSLILLETDKLILSKMLTLDEFGYYVLASTVAMGLNLIIVPLFTAVYPKFSQLVAQDGHQQLVFLYHKSCQLMTVLVMPLALVISAFSEPILQIWSQDQIVARESSPLLSILVIGTACNALMNIPYALQLAHAWTRLSVIVNLVAIIVLVPALVIMIQRYGTIGAAAIWAALNLGYILFSAPIIHSRLLKGEFGRWFFADLFLPTVLPLSVVVASRAAMPDGLGGVGETLWILLTLSAALLASALVAPLVRDALSEGIHAARIRSV